MGTPREPFLKKGDRVLHRRVNKVGTVDSMTRGLDVDRAVIRFDDGTKEEDIPATECSVLSKSNQCGACDAGKHEDCSGWCFCTCDYNRK